MRKWQLSSVNYVPDKVCRFAMVSDPYQIIIPEFTAVYWNQRARFTLLEFIGVFDKSEHCFSRQFELQQCTGGLNESL